MKLYIYIYMYISDRSRWPGTQNLVLYTSRALKLRLFGKSSPLRIQGPKTTLVWKIEVRHFVRKGESADRIGG